MGRHAVVSVGTELALAFSVERAYPPSQYVRELPSQTLTFKVKWIAAPQMVDREDVALLEVKRDGRYVEVTI